MPRCGDAKVVKFIGVIESKTLFAYNKPTTYRETKPPSISESYNNGQTERISNDRNLRDLDPFLTPFRQRLFNLT